MFLHIITNLNDEKEILSRFEEYREEHAGYLITDPVQCELVHFDLDTLSDLSELKEVVLEGRKYSELAVVHTAEPERLDGMDESIKSMLNANCLVLKG